MRKLFSGLTGKPASSTTTSSSSSTTTTTTQYTTETRNVITSDNNTNEEPPRDVSIHNSRLPTVGSSHDCGSLSQVVMVRKTDQRVINHNGQTNEVVTFETIQTYKGHKPDRTIVTKQSGDEHLKNHLSALSLTNKNDTKETGANNSDKVDTKKKIITKKSSPILKKNEYSQFENECLQTHNELRAKHNSPPLKLNKKLCKFAEEWAKIIALRGNPVHRSNSPYGENIFCAWSSASDLVVDGKEPVDNWYSEIQHHTFGKEATTLKTGHFTQVVWRDSKELGVAQAKNRSGQVFVVANYDPPGNFIGSFSENVPPIGGFSTKTKPETLKLDLKKHIDISKETKLDLFSKQILKHHNELRKKHHAPDLKLSDELQSTAQDWANQLAKEDRFAHRPNCIYGENLYCLWSSDSNAEANPKDLCRSWYDEIKEYTFGIEPRGALKSGHFTQLVWKSSLELGVGVAKTQKGKVLVVCNYHPRGNVMGQFSKNVLN